MLRTFTDSRLANLGAGAIHDAFDTYHSRFKQITRRALLNFELRDWRAMADDAAARLDLYGEVVTRTARRILELLGLRIHDKLVWASIKAVYSSLIGSRDDWELAETFLNSITRRIFTTFGVDPQIEFVDSDFDTPPSQATQPLLRRYANLRTPEDLMDVLLTDYAFSVPYEDRAQDFRRAAQVIADHLRLRDLAPKVNLVEMLVPTFFRGQRAYAVGRMWCDATQVPLVLAFRNDPGGIRLDAVLCAEDDVSILFSFTRAYFHVDVHRPHDLVRFIHQIIPQKRLAELYIAIGYNRHGKTELYRDLVHHLQESDEQFVIASGVRGMVMLVFTLPSFDVVFKIIRDSFDEPKRVTRAEVMGKYNLVFRHDRAGRLIDAQEFEYLEFDRARFSEPLLQEMLKLAAHSVKVDGQRIVIKHLYAERRVHPLDYYTRQAGAKAVRDAVIDYGWAIKDLAAANIFPGDILLKNFGVTRHGRVVFYDYDELCLLTECNFREMPAPRDAIEEMSDEPWFYVGEHDCFPVELKTWLGLPEPWRSVFMEHHADLYEVRFWRDMQARIRAGELIDILPYAESRRLDDLAAVGHDY